eukprot:12426807-Karenia_brevis.AAC.1
MEELYSSGAQPSERLKCERLHCRETCACNCWVTHPLCFLCNGGGGTICCSRSNQVLSSPGVADSQIDVGSRPLGHVRHIQTRPGAICPPPGTHLHLPILD